MNDFRELAQERDARIRHLEKIRTGSCTGKPVTLRKALLHARVREIDLEYEMGFLSPLKDYYDGASFVWFKDGTCLVGCSEATYNGSEYTPEIDAQAPSFFLFTPTPG